jgi:hypothetical protein
MVDNEQEASSNYDYIYYAGDAIKFYYKNKDLVKEIKIEITPTISNIDFYKSKFINFLNKIGRYLFLSIFTKKK